MDCTETRSRLVEAVEGELKGPQLTALQQHLQECGACREEFRRLRRASDALSIAVFHLAPPTSHLTRERRDRLSEACARGKRPIRLLSWRKMVAAAAVAAIIAAAPFIIGDLGRLWRSPGGRAPMVAEQQQSPEDNFAVMLGSTGARPAEQPVQCVPVQSASSTRVEPAERTRLVRTDTPGVSVPVRHILYDAEESSRWW